MQEENEQARLPVGSEGTLMCKQQLIFSNGCSLQEEQPPQFTPDVVDPLIKLLTLKLAPTMANPVFFAIPILHGEAQEWPILGSIRSVLSGIQKNGTKLSLVELRVPGEEIINSRSAGERPHVDFQCFAIDTRSVETVKDKLKEALWPVWVAHGNDVPELHTALTKQQLLSDLISLLSESSDQNDCKKPERRMLSVDRHGIFSPTPKKAKDGIINMSFDHGGGHFYRCRICDSKLESVVAGLDGIRRYLRALPADCPNHFFKLGPRMSAVRWPVAIEGHMSEEHDLPRLAREALLHPQYKGAHDNVEVYCIKNDPSSIAVEVPVWLEPGELKTFSSLFSHTLPLSGHVDLLRFVDHRIEVWDYKPDVTQETSAGLQVLLYAISIAIRTALPLSKFRCGYFDAAKAVLFEPSSAKITLENGAR